MALSRQDRLWAVLRGDPVDRPPVNFYEIGGFTVDPGDPDPFNVYNDPSWKPLLDLAENHTDLIRMGNPIQPLSDKQRSQKAAQVTTEHTGDENSRHTRTTIRIAGRVLTSHQVRNREVDTTWSLEYLLKTSEDVKAYLQLPDEFFQTNLDIESLRQQETTLGDRGIVMVDAADPVCHLLDLFGMENFTIFALTESSLCHQLLQKLACHIHKRTETIARDFPGHLWRIYGPEVAAEPYLPPRLFEEYVVRYTAPMVEIIHTYNGLARIHCHGRIRAVLDYIVQMGADAIDPLEPPPQGDVELDWVRQKYGEKLVLFGNLEIADIENAPPDKFRAIVRKTLEQAASAPGRGFVLMPSAAPYGRHITPNTLQNYQTMADMATHWKY